MKPPRIKEPPNTPMNSPTALNNGPIEKPVAVYDSMDLWKTTIHSILSSRMLPRQELKLKIHRRAYPSETVYVYVD